MAELGDRVTHATITVQRRVEYTGDRCHCYCGQLQAYRDGLGALRFQCDAFGAKLDLWIESDGQYCEFIAIYRCAECMRATSNVPAEWIGRVRGEP